MLSDVVGCLRCPVCGDGLVQHGRALACGRGHGFDIAKQGYVNLLPGGARATTADSAEMVRARAEFLDAGHFDTLARVVTARAAAATGPVDVANGLVVDAGGGTGHYLRHVLDRLGGAAGLVLDTSTYALRRAARAHPRAGAVGWDVWRPLPVRDSCACLVLNVFAPRNGAEFARVLWPGGALLVVTPTSRHLGELVGTLGLVAVDERKDERTAGSLGRHFERAEHAEHELSLSLDHRSVETLVRMGPSAWHVPTPRLRERLARLPDPITVTVSVAIGTYRPR